jgi:tetraacyldisaccharide 4'-kinase
MTEKDAVKCRPFSKPHWWVVPVEAQQDPAFEDWLAGAVDPREH